MKIFILNVILSLAFACTSVKAACTPGAGFTAPCFDPADNATGVAVDTNLIVTFDAAWNNYATAKTVYIFYNNGTLWRQMAVDGAEVSGSGTINFTINPAIDMPYNEALYINFQRIFRESGSASYYILADNTTWNFTTEADTYPPNAIDFTPDDDATAVSLTDNLSIQFDEDIQKGGSGNIEIRYSTGGALFESFAIASARVTIAGDTVTINPSSSLSTNTGYYVLVDSSYIQDLQSNSWAGISVSSAWNFTTEGFDSASWNGSVKYTIRASRIDEDLTDFPTYVDLSSFPDAFFTDVEGDGSDIRVTLADQTTETAFELVNINTASKTGELWFKAANVSASTDTDFYIWYGNTGSVAYLETEVYGSQNVWTNGYRAVYHMSQDPSTGAGAIKDSTANNFDATAYNMTSADLLAGRVGNSINFDGTSDYMNTGTVILPTAGSAWHVSMMLLPHQVNRGAANVIMEQYSDAVVGRTAFQEIAGNYRFYNSASGAVTVGPAVANKWANIVFDYNGNTLRTYIDSDNGSTSSSLANIENTNTNFAVNDTGGDYKFDGLVDEVHISNTNRSAAWVKAVYQNQYRPANMVKVSDSIPFNSDNANTLFIYMGD